MHKTRSLKQQAIFLLHFIPLRTWEQGLAEQSRSGTQADRGSLYTCISVRTEARSLGKHVGFLKLLLRRRTCH